MDLITTHTNADFDALSSLVAASKLYPKARLLLPGSQEKAVRRFLALIKDKVKIECEKTCRLDDVTRLIVVDNRHKSRIGIASKVLGRRGLKVHIYDHHPRTASDIKADKDVFKEVGATVSILLEIMSKKGKLKLTPLEATLMLLGIYEETGSLSYTTTTKLDVDMVGKLLSLGANLNAVSSYLNRELTGKELTLLIDLLGSINTVNINGIEMAFACVDETGFDGERGTVVHKLQDVENYPVLFAMFQSGEKVRILARSRLEAINVNKLLGHFNGAGHSSAASARVDNVAPDRIKKEIIRLIEKSVRPKVYAKDIMTSPVMTVTQDETVRAVMKKLKDAGYKGAPVLDSSEKIVGIVSSRDLKKAILHDMGHSRIKGYMATQLVTAKENTPLHELKSILTEKGKGRIPVIKGKRLAGIVTRTDVLKKVHSSLFAGPAKRDAKPEDLVAKMRKTLPKKLMELIRVIGVEADKREINVFLVGGFVRDLLLGRKNYDLDVVVEGDAIEFGKRLAKKIGGTLVVHHKFGTATLVMEWPRWLGPSLHPDNKFKIDIATARKETYKRPAALPTVEFSSLMEDLYRRDFTINAMAVNINRKKFGMFLDFFGGIKDLEKSRIKILHDNSFIDDPTRIFRAVRFEQRFGFAIEKHTEYLIKHAVKQEMFRHTENQRIRDELVLMLKEEDPEKAVFRMKELHELRFIHPDLVLKRSIGKTFDELKKCIDWYRTADIKSRKLDAWIMYFMVILDKLTDRQAEEVLDKFVFRRGASIRIRSYKAQADRAIKRLSSRKRMMPSEVYQLLEPFAHEVTLCIMARTMSRTARSRIKKFFTDYNGMKLKIRGHDVEKEGIKPGPRYTKILKQVLCRKLDGKLATKRDELKYLRELIHKGKKKDAKRKAQSA